MQTKAENDMVDSLEKYRELANLRLNELGQRTNLLQDEALKQKRWATIFRVSVIILGVVVAAKGGLDQYS